VFLDAAIDLYLVYLTKNQSSPAHLKSVAWRLRHFAKGRPGRFVADVTRLELAEYFIDAAETRADGTIAGWVATHKAFWKWAKKRKLISKNVAKRLKQPRFDPVVRTAAPAAHVQAVLAALPAFVAHRGQRPRDVRDALLVSLSLDCGGRLGAMADLRRSEVVRALSRGVLAGDGRMVYRVTSRNKTGSVALEFCQETADLFRLWFEVGPTAVVDRVFVSVARNAPQGTLLRRDTVARAFARICQFAKVPTFRAHAVRKRNISDIMADNDPEVAQRYAGHRDLATTMVHYREKSADQVRNATAQLASSRRGNVDYDAEMARLFGVE
jgi:integrase